MVLEQNIGYQVKNVCKEIRERSDLDKLNQEVTRGITRRVKREMNTVWLRQKLRKESVRYKEWPL